MGWKPDAKQQRGFPLSGLCCQPVAVTFRNPKLNGMEA